ncbi:hypothetical protein Bca4012_044803 [Brassica carinata]|uniref:DUF659 domain-containing protein n=1 Tax=Brassica oleracea TaxID=3712 RepID=A0A3P6EDG6_BRAOL|nr:unnamed protein product [Brassica oleracea]
MALSASWRGPHRFGTPFPGESIASSHSMFVYVVFVIMSDTGAGSSQGGGSQGVGQKVDPGRKYGTMVNINVNHWKCIFCYKNYITIRAEERAALTMQYQPAVHEDDVDLDGDQPIQKAIKRKNRGPLDKWFYDAGIPFNAASHDSFKKMTELVGQYGMGLKLPSQYELRYPLLQKEVANVQAELVPNREEWVVKGCSIMSDGWHDSVVQKDIVNFLVNSPKGSVFISSKEVSEVVKDATMLFKLLDDIVEEVGEMNVVQVVTDNASNFVKAGKILEAKRPHLFWTPCAAHCLDLMLEDIGKIEAVKSAMKKCMFINAYIYCRVPLVNMMRRFTEQRNLHMPSVTRFATSFITMTQFHLQQANLKKMVTSEKWNKSKWPKEAGARKLK